MDQELFYAKKYLNEIKRDAVIGEYSDFEYTFLYDLGVSADVSNKIDAAEYPSWVGNREVIENGIRVIYGMDYKKNEKEIILKKYEYDTKKVIEKIRFNSIIGEVMDRYKL